MIPTLSNLRPIGGPELQHGRRRTIYRSNTEIVPASDYPASVALVVDLRRDDEVEAVPHPLRAHSGYRRLPLFDPSVALESAPDALSLEEQYDDWVERHRATIASAFQAIAASDDDVLVCCSAGKDRTGIISALLARLWGADVEAIGRDYAATGPLLAERFARERAESTDLGYTLRMHRCVPETAIHLIDTVEDRYGSVEGYLRHLGLSDAEIARL